MISDLSTLQAAVFDWLNRPDLSGSVVNEFIGLAEERIARDVRVRQMMATETLLTVAGQEFVGLPDRWLEGVSLRIVNPQQRLDYMTPEELRGSYVSTYSGLPRNYTVEGSRLVFGPIPSQEYSVQAVFYRRFEPLETTGTNDLIVLAPSLYLFASLSEALPYLADEQRAGLWEAKYAAAVAKVNATEASAASAGTSMRIRAR